MIARSVNVFCCYAHEDQRLLRVLMVHLKALERQGLIKLWADVHIQAGVEWQVEIDRCLDTAQIILLLVSPDFMNSDYCYSVEMQHAMTRHECGEACVIPVILRPVSWQGAPFGKLQALPPQAIPVVDRTWHSEDEAFFYIADGIRLVAEDFRGGTRGVPNVSLSQMFVTSSAENVLSLRSTPSQGDVTLPTTSYQVSSSDPSASSEKEGNTDHAIVEILKSTYGIVPSEAKYDQQSKLITLDISNKGIIRVPEELWRLNNLEVLYLSGNKLREVPVELVGLRRLRWLYLSGNQLREVPVELGELSRLLVLDLSGNQLKEVPGELGKLTSLQELDLHENQLREVPGELGKLTSLQELDLSENPLLLTPPPEIVAQGTQAILAFLRELHQQSVPRYEAKLLLVGEGGTGKSSLLRALHDESFDASLSTTHGIEVDTLILPHPSLLNYKLTLNTWDFGGQDIYRATHQFFLTKRSLYLVVWNARLGGEQGRLDYWLSVIRALAPDAPVFLVATHIDQRAPDLNIPQYRKDYPQIVEVLQVSSKTRVGIDELKQRIARNAAQLPLMGQPWPQAWIKIERELVSNSAHHTSAETYIDLCARNGVQVTLAQGTLGSYLHDLGKILYFRDDPILSSIVILKPNWVTKAISLVLEDETTRKRQGILEHTELARIWAVDEQGLPYASTLYPIFLRLMERFDLCYQIKSEWSKQSVSRSLIPQLLPYQPPSSLPFWSTEDANMGKVHVEITYRLDFLPAGIMSWFIVRTHRYTHHLHWREGVVLTYQGHFARIEMFPRRNELHIEVWGVEPRTFLVILKDTLDLILARFEGLQIKQEVPCICYQLMGTTQPCPEVYDYEKQLIKRHNQSIETVQCNESFRMVKVRDLLYGLHVSTLPQVQAAIMDSKKMIQGVDEMRSKLERINQLAEWQVRQFIRQWNLEMQKMELECPCTFMLVPSSEPEINTRKRFSAEYKLFVMCQYPSEPHCVHGSEGYDLCKPKKWWVAVSPWLKHIVTFLKYGVPIAGATLNVVLNEDVYKQIDKQVELLEKIVEDLAEKDVMDLSEMERSRPSNWERSSGVALRVLHSFLREADPGGYWDGLQRIVTEDGNIFWLCEKHAYPYRVQPLQIH